MPGLSDLIPFHFGQVRIFFFYNYVFPIGLFKLACCGENSVDPDQLVSEAS